jgi:steroid delta-isomerase-like uncharacterized protein
MTNDPKAVATAFYEVMNNWDPAALEQVCSPDMRGHAGAGADLEQLKGSIDSFINSFPDLQADVRHLVCEGDLVSSWVSYEGTHKEEFAGVPASGRDVKFAAWDLFRVEDDKIVELTQYCDLFTILNQIGALPTATPPDAYSGVEQPDA